MSEHTASYYAATANDDIRHPQLTEDINVDVCVIGGGFTGISSALHLAERGYDVVLLEGERVGWGASGRNGGQICTAYNKSMNTIEKLVGKDGAQAMWDVEVDSKNMIRERVERHNIDCDLRWGYLHAAAKPSHMGWVNDTHEEWERYGYTDTAVYDKQRLEAHLQSKIYHGALWENNAGHLHPLNYALGLARAAKEAGVRIFEDSRVLTLDKGPTVSVKTDKGSVRAKFLVAAGNAYLGNMIPKLYRRVMPVGSFIVATEPLGAERASALIANNDAVSCTNNIVDYYRLSSDGRMLFGGRANYSGYEPSDLFAAVRPRMLNVFPQLADARLHYAWGGNLAITLDRLPHVGSMDGNIFFAHGYSGHGVAHTGICGKLIAQAIAGTAEQFDVMAKIRHQPFPGGPIRTPMLALGMLYYKMRDYLS
ncbi:MAG: FAD-binding oxidoreductase [Rhodospirillaceae bacterium]|jgi:gamma-glutamylputrescine oxidase|nr:FAD-binding oxidoreductase [Rhodospirillaceae bacterium]MBT5245468.1 FAD-binding oxidoreductase [Rhodospirillaceae bacterium]MBT5562624.1 FAD-binding oxidoreductase [Rhodospirillaceae bacterium]MBT6242518.1 FAD-binding oxidoreductase [Rhodospirillaceae bacterium]MBT7136570.1 FAD-binding oxidoreductase [Rhodospirillaceae bacterium]